MAGEMSEGAHELRSVLVLGSGPIVIGQAAEFDYAGAQACKALREEGLRVILVNSNPATIMTDENMADAVYIEPLTVEVVSRIIEQERPDGLLPTLGGQTGLNLAVALAATDILERCHVKVLGTPLDAIRKAEDRQLFKNLLTHIGEPSIESEVATDPATAVAVGRRIGLPLIIRPAYTLGGTGGGIARTWDELDIYVASGLRASPMHQILVEKYLGGWKEIEYEVMRDAAGTCITVCNMENIDPLGVHTGDSIVVAPSQTLTDKEYQMLRSSAFNIIGALGIEGGCNVQYALDPYSMQYYVIEVNPRVSRSSALASKATGYPIARVAAKIATGKRLDEIPNAVTRQTTAAFEPALDYVVVKIPRWPFDKFPTGDRSIGTQMKATGEVMAIDRSFAAAFQKAVRSLEMGGKSLLWEEPQWSQLVADGETPEYIKLIEKPNDRRLWAVFAALRRDVSVEEICRLSRMDRWFVEHFNSIVQMERRLLNEDLTPHLLRDAKRIGFPDDNIAELSDTLTDRVRAMRRTLGIRPVYKMVDTCAGEFDAVTPYFYSTYDQENEAAPILQAKAMVIGSGPIRIGQGIEFDYCSVHSAWALQAAGIKSIMVNSNPETVSTDFDTSDRLYFEPLDEESIFDILDNERVPLPLDSETDESDERQDDEDVVLPTGSANLILQFGGQTAINLAETLALSGANILGSSADTIDIAEDRRRFEDFAAAQGIPQPPGATVNTMRDAFVVAARIGYPVLVRPSYVLGGRAMEIVHSDADLKRYVENVVQVNDRHPILVDKYLEGKEVEVDGICDGEQVLIPGVMEHIERAGVHSGDSYAIYPGVNLYPHEVNTIVEYATRVGLGMRVRGLFNIQFVIFRGQVFILEVNPRASRTVPFLSKVTGVPMVTIATHIMLGRSLAQQGYSGGLWPRQPLVAVKAPVFSMAKLSGVDTYLGPEMKSTGEVMGIDRTYPAALRKALMAAGMSMPAKGALLCSIADRDKTEALPIIRRFAENGYDLYATEGTAAMIEASDLPVHTIAKKIGQGHPTILDLIREGTVHGVVNTMTGERAPLLDGFKIRRAAAESGVPCFTSLDTFRAAADALSAAAPDNYNVQPIYSYRQKQ